MSGERYEVIEDVWCDEYDFDAEVWVPKQVAAAGEVVYRYRGATYGVISRDGVACSRGGETVTPFFEVPWSALRAVEEPEVGS